MTPDRAIEIAQATIDGERVDPAEREEAGKTMLRAMGKAFSDYLAVAGSKIDTVNEYPLLRHYFARMMTDVATSADDYLASGLIDACEIAFPALDSAWEILRSDWTGLRDKARQYVLEN